MNDLINKIGLDKIAHFGIGAATCSFITMAFLFSLPIGNIQEYSWSLVLLLPIPGYILTALFAWAKEMNDNTPDIKDFVASMLGCVFVHIGAVIGWLLHFGNGRDLITTWWGWVIFGVIMTALAVAWVVWVARNLKKTKKK